MAWSRRTSSTRPILPAHRWQGLTRGQRFWRGLKPWLGTAVLIGLAWYFFSGPQRIAPEVIPAGPTEVVSGTFTRCGKGRAANCVIDGDTIMLGQRTVRLIGIDAPETHPARGPEEARLGEAATVQLLELVNQGPLRLAGPVPPVHDEYGRELHHLLRARPDGTVQSIADDLVASGAARAYLHGSREPWC